MPVYEFKCEDCDRKFDVVATLAEKDSGLSPMCPKCGGRRVRQVFGRFTLLAGSKTDDDFEDTGADQDSPEESGLDEPGDESLGDDFDDEV